MGEKVGRPRGDYLDDSSAVGAELDSIFPLNHARGVLRCLHHGRTCPYHAGD